MQGTEVEAKLARGCRVVLRLQMHCEDRTSYPLTDREWRRNKNDDRLLTLPRRSSNYLLKVLGKVCSSAQAGGVVSQMSYGGKPENTSWG